MTAESSSSDSPLSNEANNPFTSPANIVSTEASRPSTSNGGSRPSSFGPTAFQYGGVSSRQNSSSSIQPRVVSTAGSMVLYRVPGEDEYLQSLRNRNSLNSHYSDTNGLLPPRALSNQSSIASFGFGDDLDHKYPLVRNSSPTPAASPLLGPRGIFTSIPSTPSSLSTPRGLIPYAYDPGVDSLLPDDQEDILHDPKASEADEKKLFAPGGLLYHNGSGSGSGDNWGWRGVWNTGMLTILILALLALFLGYPVITEVRDRPRKDMIDGNVRVNSTGQVPVLFGVRELVDLDTPDDVKTRTGFDGEIYDLVFSDEFERPGRTFYPGDDPYFEAVDIWYGVTQDLEWYDPQQITTRDGALVITMDSAETLVPHLTPGSTAPFTAAENHDLTYRSGMLQSWNKLCFSSGYIEVAVKLPAPGPIAQGYWPGTWTMGNLGRAGYRATTDGLWPYSYDACDVGTFPNQTNLDGLTPAAATFSEKSWPEYDNKLSVLPGQRLSACTCPNQDHPGPYGNLDPGSRTPRYRGRGAPEIDIIEIQRDNNRLPGNVASQSCQIAPFTHDYTYTDTPNAYTIYNASTTYPNGWPGSPLQQAISGLSKVPDDGFEIPGGRYVTYGFEYWADPNNRDDGFITWQVDGKPTVTMRPPSVGPDKGPGGSMVDQRLIPEEPMHIIMNLGISRSWTTILPETLQFPAEMKFDYIRIYQRRGHENIGCDPEGYPTTEYIRNHLDQYMNRTLLLWEYEKPTNRLYNGCT
ncbi:glycoside hydrolase family 16 protein [Moniliophthora roreri MCA 2997]|uniref:Glycoside hydrolase family 16 protein n=2 Tax=Moniliophthora roreri TaxID=221103 RepID=V2WGH0_MONRO|nr:glycoside hydrolase family 16 protein [Moniliophthora roreri MCA 2997]